MTSTSKTFVFMWTLLVGWALICLLIVGELIATHPCAAITDPEVAIRSCMAAKDQIGLLQIGWRAFVAGGLAASYLVLLGIPAAAAVAAKGITQGKIAAARSPRRRPRQARTLPSAWPRSSVRMPRVSPSPAKATFGPAGPASPHNTEGS
jgi:hypothetical protein